LTHHSYCTFWGVGLTLERRRVSQSLIQSFIVRPISPFFVLGLEKYSLIQQNSCKLRKVKKLDHRVKINRSGQLGFFKKRSNAFLTISTCPVASQRICSALAELNKTGVLQPLAQSCPELELLESPADETITLVLRGNNPKNLPSATLRELTNLSTIEHLGWSGRKGFQYLSSPAKPLRQDIQLKNPHMQTCSLSWSGGCFSQVNPGQNEQLIKLVCEVTGDLQRKTVLDLYCGMGNFSVPLGCCGGTVTGIEGNRESIHWAEKNARQAGISARFRVADVRQALNELVQQGVVPAKQCR
jgi:23S rRNA (uracil1939-C5)-methyltransferase